MAAAAAKPPLGTVIQTANGAHSMWDGKQWAPAAQGQDGSWRVDTDGMARMGLGGAPKLSPEDKKAMDTMIAETQSRSLLAERAQSFMGKQGAGKSGVGTGPIYADTPLVNHIVPNIARTFTDVFMPGQAAKLQELDSINNSTWTALRPTGSGPIRAYEATGWKKAFPSTTNFPDANQGITDRLAKEDTESRSKLRFVQDYMHSGRGNFGDALAAWATQSRGAGNDALRARSAAAKARPGGGVPSGTTIDIFGRPVKQ